MSPPKSTPQPLPILTTSPPPRPAPSLPSSPLASSSPSTFTHPASPNPKSTSFSMVSAPHPPATPPPRADRIILGVCAMDVKAGSTAMTKILKKLQKMEGEGVEVVIFGDQIILGEPVEKWPKVSVLVSFFSRGFPLAKAIVYSQLPNPTAPPLISINSLALQFLLQDRRNFLEVLTHIGVDTPRRAVVSRDGGPRMHRMLRERIRRDLGLVLSGPPAEGESDWGPVVVPERWRGRSRGIKYPHAKEVVLREDGDAIIVDGVTIEKPFLEKPVDADNHDVWIYYRGGGGRRLFRKIGNKSSEEDSSLYHPRVNGSFIYEEFLDVDNAEDIKVYTVGPDFAHAEARKSPVVDGLVSRNADGKETRQTEQLTAKERGWAKDIVDALGQRVCGFDLLRCTTVKEEGGVQVSETRSLVIDVNGWSFVKGNDGYYDKAAEILSGVCKTARQLKEDYARSQAAASPGGVGLAEAVDKEKKGTSKSSLKAVGVVFRHSDRTPKQKVKFSFPGKEEYAKPFIQLLRGQNREIMIRDRRQLKLILEAVDRSEATPGLSDEILEKLGNLRNAVTAKLDDKSVKAQLKPGLFKDKDKAEGKGKDKDKKKAKKVKEDDDEELTETENEFQKKDKEHRGKAERTEEWVNSTDNLSTTPTMIKAIPVPFSKTHDKAPPSPPAPAPSALPTAQPLPVSTSNGSLASQNGYATPYYTPKPPASVASSHGTEELAEHDPFEDDFVMPEGLEKLQLIVKWGGESTHAAKKQASDMGAAFRDELDILNKDVLNKGLVKIFTSTETRVNNTAIDFAEELLDRTEGRRKTLRRKTAPRSTSLVINSITQARELLDDNNAAKEFIDVAKEKLKHCLRPGESQRTPELNWTQKEEPQVVVKRLLGRMSELKVIMDRNYANGNAKKIETRWCNNENEWFFQERWNKIFEDFGGKQQEKFDPSRVSELYDNLKYDALHHQDFLFQIFDDEGKINVPKKVLGPGEKGDRRLHDLYKDAKVLFDLVAPQEYGWDWEDKEKIGYLTSLPLLRKIVAALEEAKNTGNTSANFYFTKESHITTLLHLILASGIPQVEGFTRGELDYCSYICFELYEKTSGEGSDTDSTYTIKLSISEGAHTDSPLDSRLDSNHALTVQRRKDMTAHIPFDVAVAYLSKHFDKGLSFSTTPLEGDEVYLRKTIHDEVDLPLKFPVKSPEERARMMSSNSSDVSEGMH